MDSLNAFMDGSAIASWEAIIYTLLVSFLSLMRLHESCLVNSFSFTYYWGFKNLLQAFPGSTSLWHDPIVPYIVCGLAVLGFVIFNYLRQGLNFRLGVPAAARAGTMRCQRCLAPEVKYRVYSDLMDLRVCSTCGEKAKNMEIAVQVIRGS